MTRRLSLRERLTLIILIPLLITVLAIAFWAARDAEERAADRFDRSLLVTALGISRDTAFSGGDALSQDTRDLLADTSGGPVFYHVYAPDGVFVTGYATPPVPPEGAERDAVLQYFDAIYQGSAVRAVRFTDLMTIDNLSGEFTFTVWQDLSLRDGFVQSLSRRTYGVMLTLVLAVAVIVWFGVRFGLAPLLDLEDAIAQRSSEDLSPIRRQIPVEVRGIVGRLNMLLGELSGTMQAKDDFISNAAHQLRNPIAGVLALSEAVVSARTLEESQTRGRDLLEASRHAAKLTEDLLALERITSMRITDDLEPINLSIVLRTVVAGLAPLCEERGISLSEAIEVNAALCRVDQTLFEQALTNLIMNALTHGGPDMSVIEVTFTADDTSIRVEVNDNGRGLEDEEFDLALSRFAQVSPATGTGLGLPIAKAVVEGASGQLMLKKQSPGLSVQMDLPRFVPPQ
ncbi:sensor histidine kinase N-terminal domain-containing protein [Gymnodinialimonas sp.]